jgi:hypothetical protein
LFIFRYKLAIIHQITDIISDFLDLRRLCLFHLSFVMASASSSSQSRKPLFLLGTYVEEIRGVKLPSNQQGLGHFLYLHKEQNKTVREASTMTVEKIEEFWRRAHIPIRHKQDCVKKVEALFQRWQALKKNSNRRSVTQQNNEAELVSCLDDLFDIAHANAMNMMTIEEDKAFLLAQREKGRRGAMSSVDNVLAKKEQKRTEKLAKEQERRLKSLTEADQLRQQVILESVTHTQ